MSRARYLARLSPQEAEDLYIDRIQRALHSIFYYWEEQCVDTQNENHRISKLAAEAAWKVFFDEVTK
jgi:hypothetical protein